MKGKLLLEVKDINKHWRQILTWYKYLQHVTDKELRLLQSSLVNV